MSFELGNINSASHYREGRSCFIGGVDLHFFYFRSLRFNFIIESLLAKAAPWGRYISRRCKQRYCSASALSIENTSIFSTFAR